MRSNRHLATTKLVAVLLCLVGYLSGTSCKHTGEQVAAQAHNRPASPPSSTSQRPKVYPHSIVPGGIHTIREFATKPDAIAREHYHGLRAIQVIKNPREGRWYVSFRIGNSIYWTRKRLRIPQGEALLKLSGRPGILWARTRCGNLLSPLPQKAVLPANREKKIESDLNTASTDEDPDAPLNISLLPFENATNSFPDFGIAEVQPLFLNTTAPAQMPLQTGGDFGSASGAFFPFNETTPHGSFDSGGARSGNTSRPSNDSANTTAVAPEPSSWSLVLGAAAVFTIIAGARHRRLRLKGRSKLPWPKFCLPAGYLMPRISAWAWVAVAWIGVIFFSSTSLASKWAEAFFNSVSSDFLGSLRNSSSLGLVHLFADKGFHITLFCVLALLLWLALGKTSNKVWIILGAGALIGSISELLQRLFPDRDPALRDVLINTTGTAVGIALCLFAVRMRNRRHTFLQPETQVTSSSPR